MYISHKSNFILSASVFLPFMYDVSWIISDVPVESINIVYRIFSSNPMKQVYRMHVSTLFTLFIPELVRLWTLIKS